jgi:hypothetical protein
MVGELSRDNTSDSSFQHAQRFYTTNMPKIGAQSLPCGNSASTHTMSEQDRFDTLQNDLEKYLLNLGYANWDAAKQAIGQLLGAIIATKKKYVEESQRSTDELPDIMDLEKRIRQNKNDIHQTARDEPKFPATLHQAQLFAKYYNTPDKFLARNKTMDGYKERAQQSESDLALTLKTGIKMKELAILMLKEFQELRREFEDTNLRLSDQWKREAEHNESTTLQ